MITDDKGRNLYTRNEVSKLIGCSDKYILNLMHKGKIMKVVRKNKYLVVESDIERIRTMWRMRESLCWDCIRSAAPKGIQCIWDASKAQIPVEGASLNCVERCGANMGKDVVQIAIVTDCPKFISLYEDNNMEKMRNLRKRQEVEAIE